jgi:hypothetical protein
VSDLVPVIITLATVIVTLAGVIVWAVKFLTSRLVNAFDGLKVELHANTTALRGMESQQKETNTLVLQLARKEL